MGVSNPTEKIDVNTGDVEIGAVEIKNATTDDRAVVETAGADAKSNTSNRLAVFSKIFGFNGTTWDRLRTGLVAAQSTFTGILNVISMGRYNSSAPTLTNGQIAPRQLDVNGNAKQVGNVAANAADSGNPVKVGGKYNDTPPTLGDGDRGDLELDARGNVKATLAMSAILVERVSNTDGASTALTTFGATASKYNYITTIVVHNAHASTNGYVDLRDGVAGSVIMTIPLPANGGAVINLPVPLKQTTANTALAFDVSAAITTVYLSFVGYQA